MQEFSNILTITTDWHNDDYYTGMLNGIILSISKDIRISTISNNVPLHNFKHAAFILKNCFFYYPKGTIHLCMVSSDNCKKKQMLVFEYENHFFIVPNNGIISLITNYLPQPIYSIPINSHSFSSLKSAAIGVAAINGEALSELPIMQGGVVENTGIEPPWNDTLLRGSVIYIDSHKNVITNITKKLVEQFCRGREYLIYIENLGDNVDRVVNTYSEAEDGEIVALFNSIGLLEIAVIKGEVATTYNMRVGSSIQVKIVDNTPKNNNTLF